MAKNGWQKIWMAKNGKKVDGKKYGWQKIPEYESSLVKNCWGSMTPLKNWA